MNSNALDERRARVAYAKGLGVAKPSTLKKDALEEAIKVREAEIASENAKVDETIAERGRDEDGFDPIDPTIEGDHLTDEIETIQDAADVRDATREAWLMSAVDALRPLLKQAGAIVPEKIAVSVGFGSKNVRKTLGVCFPTQSTSEGWSHMFISPVLEDAVEVLAVLAHELIHASDDCESKHGGHFAQCAKSLGLEGKMTATVAGAELKSILAEIASELGSYPHVKLNLSGIKKQTTRLLAARCPDTECPYVVVSKTGKEKRIVIRVTRMWVELDAMPSCACGTKFRVDGDETEGDEE